MNASAMPTIVPVTITTDASGDRVAYSEPLYGYIDHLEFVMGTMTGYDLTVQVKGEAGDYTVYTGTGASASARLAVTSRYLLTGQRLEVTVANGGDAKTGTLYAYVCADAVADPATQTTLAALLTASTPKATAINGGDVINVTNVSGTVAAANALRRSLFVCNNHATARLTVTCGPTAVDYAGYVLLPGQSTTIRDYTGIVTGILSVADATDNVSIVEI